MMRAHLIALVGGFVALIALAYFALLAARPEAFAHILLRRGYEQRGWTEQRLTIRVRALGVLGGVVALAAILLAIVRFVG